MVLMQLFLEFLKIGGLSFGGGLSTLPFIFELANKTGWITEEYVSNILSVSQITPGPLACNIGTLVGFKKYGIIGALVANFAFTIPAICFMGILYKLFDKIKENENICKIIKILRSGAMSLMVCSSESLFKSGFMKKNNQYNEINFKSINCKSVLLGIIIFLFYFFLTKKKTKVKINSLSLMLISSIIAIIFRV